MTRRRFRPAVPLLLGLNAWASGLPAHAQVMAVSSGDTIRVSNATVISESMRFIGVSREGVVIDVNASEVVLASDGREEILVLQQGSRIEIRRGDRSWGPVKGALFGITAAAAAGLAWEGSDSRERQGCEIVDRSLSGSPIYRCDRSARNMDELWFVTGGVVGLALGSLIRVSRWQPVANSNVALALVVTPDALALTLRLPVRGGS